MENSVPVIVTGPDDTPRDPKRLLESVQDNLWMMMHKTLAEPTSMEGQRRYWDYERAKDIIVAILALLGAERDLLWLICDASYYRINLGVTDEELDKISKGFGRSISLKPVELE